MQKTRILVFLAALATVLTAGPPSAAAQTYLGEFCWSIFITADESGPVSEGPGVLKAGVTQLGGAYYLLQGRLPTEDNPAFVNGTAVVIGNDIWINGTTTQDHSPSSS